jgi:hypothetical protein
MHGVKVPYKPVSLHLYYLILRGDFTVSKIMHVWKVSLSMLNRRGEYLDPAQRK